MTESLAADPTTAVAATASWRGSIVGLHLAPRAMLPMRSVPSLELRAGHGVVGDRYAAGRGFLSEKVAELGLTSAREVTLFAEETLHALLAEHGITLLPTDHRRNITTRGVPLNELIGCTFRVGGCFLQGSDSTPCKHLEEVIGKPVALLLFKRAGLNARILRGGVVSLGDVIQPN